MIATVGLLTPLGLGHFYAVFEDYESVTDANRDHTLFLDPRILPYDSESEKERKLQYEEWLTKAGVLQSSAIEMVAYTNRMATLDTNTKMVRRRSKSRRSASGILLELWAFSQRQSSVYADPPTSKLFIYKA